MDKEQLKQIQHVTTEIETLQDQIDDIKVGTVTDKVKGSSHDFPYTARNFTIEGVDADDYGRKAAALERKLIKKRDELIDLKDKAQDFINGIEDSLTRQIISLRYISCLSWYEIADKIGGSASADSVRKISERYFKKL